MAAILSLSACVEPNTVTVDGASYPAAPVAVIAAPRGSQDPASVIPTTAQAAQIFNAACIDALPDFRTTDATLTKLGLRRNPATGVYLHKTLDLSVALVQAGDVINCSIVFATDKDPKATADAVAAYGVSKKKRFFIGVMGTPQTRTYLNAQVAAQ
ncbi:MAG: hypothetical protein WBN04_16880 [Paracoccaceae bacterium]